MTIITQELSFGDSKAEFQAKAFFQKWRGIDMIRKHSFLATILEIVRFAEDMDATKIGIVGDPHTGKTTMALAIAHEIHVMAKIPFAVRLFDKDDLLDFEKVLKDLKPANYILIFDDVSFLGAQATKKQLEYVKQAVTQIRHLPGGHDVKIVSIMNYHYTLGLDKYLRQANFNYFTSIGSSEIDNMEKLVGQGNMRKVKEFAKKASSCPVTKRFSFNISKKHKFTYKWRDPWIPALFWNNEFLRNIISPTREWLAPVCSICARAKGELTASQIPIDQFCLDGEKKFNKSHWLRAIKILLAKQGINTDSERTIAAEKYLQRSMMKKEISFEDLIGFYQLKEVKADLRKKLHIMLEDPQYEATIQTKIIKETETQNASE